MAIFIVRFKRLLRFALLVWPLHLALCSEPGFEVSLQVTGGAYRLFRQGTDHPELQVTGWSRDSVSHDIVVRFEIYDLLEQPKTEALTPITLHLPADGSTVSQQIPLTEAIGYRAIFAVASDGGEPITRSTDLGIVWPPWPGVRPDSFFGSNVPLQEGEKLQLLENVGLKVQRTHFAPNVVARSINWPKEFPAGQAVPLDFESVDTVWKTMRAHGLWILPIAGNALTGAGVFDRTALADQLGMYGPPGDKDRFINTWKTILKHYPEITTFEFWNEPWIFGWTWASTPDVYRDLQRDWCKMALAINPHYRLLAGNSVAFVRDELEPFPDSWDGLIDGITNHPYADGVVERNFRSGDVFRPIDETRLTARDLGLPYAYLTEGGTAYKSSAFDPEPYDNNENAQKLVQYYVFTALAGLFMGNAQIEIGYGPGWTRSNTAFAVLTHFLEDRVPLVDIWPRQELIWGGIFANHKFATKAIESLPRGSELKARWKVSVPPERDQDETKVAVIWGLTGRSAQWLDSHGELVIADASDLHAYNMMGEEIAPSGGRLILPLSANPVYVTSDFLDLLTFRDRIQHACIRRLTPINFYPFSLPAPADEEQDLTVRMQNQVNRRLSGTLFLRARGTTKVNSVRFSIGPGELADIPIRWPSVPVRADNRYPVRITAYLDNAGHSEADSAGPMERCLASSVAKAMEDKCEADSVGTPEHRLPSPRNKPEHEANAGESFPPISQEHTIAVARFEKRTIHLTGKISDWSDLTPVTVDSSWLQQGVTGAASLQNPNQETKPDRDGNISGNVYTAYDDDSVYIGAAVHEDDFYCSSGLPFTATTENGTIILPYLQGVPNGLHFATECGSVFQFSFGFRDRVPNAGRQIDDPWAWKGVFYDTDYSYVAHFSAQGAQLIRIWGPDTGRRNGYQTESVPEIGPIPGALILISRNDKTKVTLYEIKIPRRQLALFDPDSGRCRFGFVLYSGELNNGVQLAWSDVAGVFDYWKTPGSFPPTWRSHRACQTFFGIER